MENTINLLVTHAANHSPVSQNKTTDNQRYLINTLASVNISQNVLPAIKESQQNYNGNDSGNRIVNRCPNDVPVLSNYNQHSEIKDNSQYHTYTKERFKALRQYINAFFPHKDYPEGEYAEDWYFPIYLHEFMIENQKESVLSFDPAGKKILQFLNDFSLFPILEGSDEETGKEKNVLNGNINLEPKDHALCYPEMPLYSNRKNSISRKMYAFMRNLDADISKCEANERRLGQNKR